MTEAEWLARDSPAGMDTLAVGSPRASDRTCRLYVVAFWSWHASRLEEASDLLRRVARMEHWAEVGTPPKGIRTSRQKDSVFFNHDASRALRNTTFAPNYWLDGREEAMPVLAAFLRDIFGNPFRPATLDAAWRTPTAVALAGQMYESRDFGAMPILADALQDAGCDSDDILNHCRGPGPHVRGCWVVDLVLGKA
jgi:hypothetical protein